MSTVENFADRLDAGADRLTTVARTLPVLGAPPGAFGAEGAGAPGRLGHDLHRHWTAVLTARSREAETAAAGLAELAGSLRTTDREYTETDETARHRFGRQW